MRIRHRLGALGPVKSVVIEIAVEAANTLVVRVVAARCEVKVPVVA
jgi:hypothetical protein